MIKVLIADDSPTVREFLAYLLGADPEIEVIGAVADGREVLAFLEHDRPDVITMDIQMPGIDGLEATRRIMETDPHPVVIVSGLTDQEKTASFAAFEAGALAVVMRPHGWGHSAFDETASEIVRTVKAMAEVKLVRRWSKVAGSRTAARSEESGINTGARSPKIIGLGASTGGPAVLKTIIGGLPADFPLPIVLVQHMSVGFLQGFADWLAMVTRREVRIPEEGEEVRPGRVYLAPENLQMGISAGGRVLLDAHSKEYLRPSVSHLFRSLAYTYGSDAIGVLLTGMGRDGADAMRILKQRGGLTIVQNAETCVVNGMPMEAIKLGAADFVLPPEKISAMLREVADGNRDGK